MLQTTTYQYNKLGWLKSVTSPKGYTTSYYYDKNGNLLKTVNPDGGVMRFVFDFRNNITQKIMPTQYLSTADTAATFSAENIQNSASTAYTQTGHGYRYVYETNGALKSVTDPLNFTSSYTYDIYGNKTTETMPNGAIYGYTYNVMNLLETATFKETSPSTAVTLTSYAYDILANGNTTMTATQYFDAGNMAVTKTTFDYAGRAIRVDQPDVTHVSSQYNANGTLASLTDANGNTTYYAYDGLNRQIKQWSPVSTGAFSYSAITYDKSGRVLTKSQAVGTAPNGVIPAGSLITSAYTYNADGLLTQETTNGGAKTTYMYDNNGNMTEKRSYYDTSNYNREYYTYNNIDKPATLNIETQYRDIYGYADNTTSLALTTSLTYDKNGNTLTETDPNGITTTYTYDLMDRLLTTSRPGTDENNAPTTITTSQTYNWAGDILASTNELGKQTSYSYDQRGFLLKITDANNGVLYFTYDRAGRKTAEVSPKNYNSSLTISNMPRTEYTYDLMSRPLRETQIYKDDTGAWKTVVSSAYTYDNNGNVIKSQDALGYQGNYGTLYEYDMQNRVTKTKDPESQIAGLPYTSLTAYDGTGRATSSTDANGVATSFTYDNNGNILTIEVGGVLTQTNTYDLLGNMLTSTDGNGNTATYTYNSLNKLRGMALPGDSTISAYTVTYEYTKLGQPASQTDSIGKQSVLTYDNHGRLLSTTEKTSLGAQPITVSSRYDKAG
ncbi:MAG: hypothetical protein FWH57_06990, partial [Oscillospiraceae bacterium]|nr:hypothetical protein [Oscillospiraceae bacterium]